MSYVRETLHPNEAVEFETQLSGIIYVFPWLLIATILTGPIGIIGVPLGVLLLICQMIGKATSEFAVTSNKVIIKTGWIFRTTIELNISKVESVDVHQGIFGRMFDYGTVIVVGTGASKQPFRTVANPLQFRKAIQAVQMREQTTQSVHTVNNTTQIAVFVSANDFEGGSAARPWDVSSLPDFQHLTAQQASPVIERAPAAALIAHGGTPSVDHSAGQDTHGEGTWASAFDDVPPWEPRSPAEMWRNLSRPSKIVVAIVIIILVVLITTSSTDHVAELEPTVQYVDGSGKAVSAREPRQAPALAAKLLPPVSKESDWVGKYDGAFDGASGTLDITQGSDQKLSISLGMAGGSCAGGIDAVVDQPAGNIITITKAPYEDGDYQENTCRLSLHKRGDEIVLHEDEVCMNHHGMSCGFNGSADLVSARGQ